MGGDDAPPPQVVMEGFLGNGKLLRPWQRRFATRMTAILPAAIVAGTMGIKGTSKLLNLSQVNLEIRFLTPWPHASRSHPSSYHHQSFRRSFCRCSCHLPFSRLCSSRAVPSSWASLYSLCGRGFSPGSFSFWSRV